MGCLSCQRVEVPSCDLRTLGESFQECAKIKNLIHTFGSWVSTVGVVPKSEIGALSKTELFKILTLKYFWFGVKNRDFGSFLAGGGEFVQFLDPQRIWDWR